MGAHNSATFSGKRFSDSGSCVFARLSHRSHSQLLLLGGFTALCLAAASSLDILSGFHLLLIDRIEMLMTSGTRGSPKLCKYSA
jgi:hypothetical protein